MNIYEFASGLNGRSYDSEIITTFEERRAKELGFVVVYGYSDDNAEFRGAYEEEIECYDGGRVFKCGEKYIDAVWCEGEFTWTYNTNIPHATFDIFDDEEKYCKGIVFELKDMFNRDGGKRMSKKKYIDYGKLLEERYRLGLDEMSRISKVNAFNHFIDTMPLADVEEVQHGKWERSEKSFSYYQYKCNNCGCDDYTQTDRQGECKLMNYCPNCGAKMDNEQER